jgi:hypothetical protein
VLVCACARHKDSFVNGWTVLSKTHSIRRLDITSPLPPRRPLRRAARAAPKPSYRVPPAPPPPPSLSPVVFVGQSPCGAGGGGASLPRRRSILRASWGLTSAAAWAAGVVVGRQGSRDSASGAGFGAASAWPCGPNLGPSGPNLGLVGPGRRGAGVLFNEELSGKVFCVFCFSVPGFMGGALGGQHGARCW